MTRHFIDIADFSAAEVTAMLDLADVPLADLSRPLAGQGAALIFEKPSARTRHSMEMAVVQLGGHPVFTRGEEVGFDTRESVEDVARIMEGFHALIAARVYDHSTITRLADVATVPVVNMLSDHSHPLQAVADALTMRQQLGDLAGQTVAYVGDYNNVARSLAEISARLGMHIRLACPLGFEADDAEIDRILLLGAASVEQGNRPIEMVVGAHAVHTDTWVSMGEEEDKEAKRQKFDGFTVDDAMMDAAGPASIFMHCLPAYRGFEVTASVIDGARSVVFQQGHNRMHAARGRTCVLDGGRDMTSKVQRQTLIVRLVGDHEVTSQPDLIDLLAAEGIDATQATVSRDLDDIGAVKVRVPGGNTVYAIPEFAPDRIAPVDQLRRVMGEWVAEVAVSGNIVVLRTPPGCAHVVASALDRSRPDGLLGTVAGDDTLMCISVNADGTDLCNDLKDFAGLD